LKKVASQYGINFRDSKELVNLFKEYNNVKTKLPEYEKKAIQLENYNRILEGLPDEVKAILNAAIFGQDYKSIIQQTAKAAEIDYSKPFEQLNERDLINKYSSKIYTKDDFDNMDVAVYNSLKEAAKLRYEAERQNFLSNIQRQNEVAKARQRAFEESIERSIARLKANNPNMGEAQVNRVKDIMMYDLHAALFNPDQTYREDAAEKIAMLEFGKETIQKQEETIGDLVKKYVAQGYTQATESILLNAQNQTLKSGGDTSTQDLIRQIVERETAFLKAR